MPTERKKDSLTPITDLRGMGEAIAVIKNDVREMRPEVRKTASTVIELATKQKITDNRINSLETKAERLDRKAAELSQPRPHDCINANKIGDLEEDTKRQTLGVTEAKKDIAVVTADVIELKTGQSKFVYWLLGAAFVVVGSVVGWYASYQVTTNEVRHLTVEQTKIRTNLEELQKTTKNLPVKFNSAVERFEVAAKQVDENIDVVKLEDVWCDLSYREKLRLQRKLPADKIPDRECL